MNTKDKQEIIERYNERLRRYGYDPRTLGWYKGRQPIRFMALTNIGKMNHHSILDVGCGFGDLLDFLEKQRLIVDYVGYDINPEFIEIAKDRHKKVKFEVRDIEEDVNEQRFDWVLSSGVFNHKVSDNEEFVRNMLTKMFEIAKLGVAVDFLSTYVDFQEGNSYHSDPKEVFDFCKSLTKRVTLRHDYLLYEFCVYLYKEVDP